jgi:hypothetical protein
MIVGRLSSLPSRSTGRWRLQLFNKINAKGTSVADASVSPVIRQTLLHWGYLPTQRDYEEYCKSKGLKY